MAKIYISSTFEDLKECRTAVYDILRKMRHDVIAMEDYVATDQRPLTKCLADVAACDVYIGIVAWRYGYIPPKDNPEQQSITEREFREAVRTGKYCLLFLLHQKALWPYEYIENGHGAKRLETLRAELATNYLACFFHKAEELAGLVSVAVRNWETLRTQNPPVTKETIQDAISGTENSTPVSSSNEQHRVQQQTMWRWIAKPTTLQTLRDWLLKHKDWMEALVAIITILGTGVGVYFFYFQDPVNSVKVTASGEGIAAGSNISVNAASGGTAVVSTGNVTIGITPEQFATELKRREQETRDELKQSTAADKEKIILLEKQLADAQAKLAQPQAALADYKAALEQAHKALDHLTDEVSTERLEQARLGLTTGDASKAEALFRQVLLVSRNKEKAAEAAYQLGKLAEGRIDYQRASQYLKQAAGLQPENPLYLNAAGNIAHTIGHYNEAEPLYQRALTISEKALGPEHPSVANILNNLALLYHDQGQYGKAEPLYQRALTISEKALGPEHPDVATSLNSLALLYYDQGQYGKAEPLFQHALAISEKALGLEHPNVATNLNNLANIFRAQGQYGKAEPLYQRALAIREKALGMEHPSVANTLNSLAELYRLQSLYGKAEPLYQRALAIREKALGMEHPDVATCLEDYAVLLRKLNRGSEAVPLEARAKKIRSGSQNLIRRNSKDVSSS